MEQVEAVLECAAFAPISEDEMAFALEKNRSALIQYATSKLKLDIMSAEDLVQDLSLKLLLKRHQYNPENGNIRAFLFKVLKNLFINTTRAKNAQVLKGTISNEKDDGEHKSFLWEGVDDDFDFAIGFNYELIKKSIAILPGNFGKALTGLGNGDTYEELAEMLAIPIGTVRSVINRGRVMLANSLHNSGIIDANGLGRSLYMLNTDVAKNKKVREHMAATIQISNKMLGCVNEGSKKTELSCLPTGQSNLKFEVIQNYNPMEHILKLKSSTSDRLREVDAELAGIVKKKTELESERGMLSETLSFFAGLNEKTVKPERGSYAGKPAKAGINRVSPEDSKRREQEILDVLANSSKELTVSEIFYIAAGVKGSYWETQKDRREESLTILRFNIPVMAKSGKIKRIQGASAREVFYAAK